MNLERKIMKMLGILAASGFKISAKHEAGAHCNGHGILFTSTMKNHIVLVRVNESNNIIYITIQYTRTYDLYCTVLL